MTFGNPHLLWLLLVFPPALVLFFWWSWRKRQTLLTAFIQARLLPGLLSGVSPAREKLRAAGLILAVVCIILALARPQWGFTWEEVKQRGLDIVVAIDTSKSMLAQDIAPNRLARAKLAALDLLQQAKSDRLGLVAFAGSAFLQCPLTIDDSAFRQSLEALDVNTMSRGGTAIAEAITTAATAFKEQDNYKVIVLMTDGEDHDSGALEAATQAAKSGVQIFTIGIGTAEGDLLQIKKPDGSTDFVRDEQGNVIKSHLNESLLQQIAGATEKGFYLPLRGAKVIDTLYEKGLAPLPKTEGKERLVKRYYERFQWPLGLAILLLMAEILFPERKRETRARPVEPSPRKAGAQTIAILMLVGIASAALGSPSSAMRDYKAGDYERALKEYNDLLKKKTDDPRLQFNAGAAAYQNRDYEEARKHFKEALAATDLKLQGLAYYNRGNSLYQLGERAADPKQKMATWQKSLQDFESSLKLNPQDPDAKSNRDFVKKQLEELKRQQQQQQQQNQSDQNKDQKNQNQDQQQQQQAKQDQNQQEKQPQQNGQNQQKQDQQQQPAQQNPSAQKQRQEQQQAQQQKQDEQKQQQASQKEDEKKDQGKPSPANPAENPEEKDKEPAPAYAAGQMTSEEARQLLDAQKSDEKLLQFKPEERPMDNSRPYKDW